MARNTDVSPQVGREADVDQSALTQRARGSTVGCQSGESENNAVPMDAHV